MGKISKTDNKAKTVPGERACYYLEYSLCSCSSSVNCDGKCPGSAECSDYVAEDEYFSLLMSGEIKEKQESAEDKKERQARINSKLSLGKSKKQLKYEQRQEDIKNGAGTGYSLFDDDRFKDIFKK